MGRVPGTTSAGLAEARRLRQPRVLVFTTQTCPWCVRVKQYLRERQVPFREIDVSRSASAARDLVRKTGRTGVPVVEIDGKPIVGFDRGRIDKLLGLDDGKRRLFRH
ncbi:MAG TPA: glutaredoxin domain-containing protein [Gaiellaceae bacterium]|nr:glutaredoxin domain-containing protein [Gaiellaceae bacterium]